jgi:hypothetical protein
MNVVPIQGSAEATTGKCPSCGSAVLPDQRYCLTCGQPCSPVRLAFLDVLQAESELRTPVAIAPAPVGYSPQPEGAVSWLRRYSGVLALLSVLLTTGLIGLLIGHWLTPSKAPAAQVLKVEDTGLPIAGSSAAPAGSATASSTGGSSSKQAAQPSSATEAKEKQEVKEAESPKAKTPAPVKKSTGDLEKISKLNGKQHEKAIEKLVEGGQPIETGG